MTRKDGRTGNVPSTILERHMEHVAFGEAGRPVVLLPTSAGRQNENVDFGLVDALGPLIDQGKIRVFSIDSINRESWADDALPPWEKLRRHGLYDRFLAEEFFPWLKALTGRDDPVLYGASLGGWQALTFAARHPEAVGRAIAFSGFFDIRRLLGGWWSEDAYYFSPQDFVPNMDEEWVARLSRVEWVLATGDGDSLLEETRRFAAVLEAKGIPHHCEIWKECFGHDWPHWREHLPRLLL